MKSGGDTSNANPERANVEKISLGQLFPQQIEEEIVLSNKKKVVGVAAAAQKQPSTRRSKTSAHGFLVTAFTSA